MNPLNKIKEIGLLHYIIIGIICYVIFLFSAIPANLIFKLKFPDITHGNISGTLWKGRAENISYSYFSIGKLEWDFKPLSLFLGRCKFSFNFDNREISGSGIASISPFSDFSLHDASIYFTEDDLEFFDIFRSDIMADLAFKSKAFIKRLDISNKKIKTGEGEIDFKDIELNNFNIAKAGVLNFAIKKKEGLKFDFKANDVLKINGEGFLNKNNEYGVSAIIESSDNADDALKDRLNIIAKPDKNSGKWHYKNKGRLNIKKELFL